MSSSAARSSSATPTASASASATGSASATASSVSIPQTAANGGLTITQPAQTAAPSFYKISENNFVTWGWNFTSLYVKPESLTLVASQSGGGNTYTITAIPGTATEVVWSPYSVDQAGSVPFAVATYTLSIWDERGNKATPTGGMMSINTALSFALYRPQTYVGLDQWKCSTCSGAYETLRQPGFMMGLFTLFAMLITGWSVLRRARA